MLIQTANLGALNLQSELTSPNSSVSGLSSVKEGSVSPQKKFRRNLKPAKRHTSDNLVHANDSFISPPASLGKANDLKPTQSNRKVQRQLFDCGSYQTKKILRKQILSPSGAIKQDQIQQGFTINLENVADAGELKKPSDVKARKPPRRNPTQKLSNLSEGANLADLTVLVPTTKESGLSGVTTAADSAFFEEPKKREEKMLVDYDDLLSEVSSENEDSSGEDSDSSIESIEEIEPKECSAKDLILETTKDLPVVDTVDVTKQIIPTNGIARQFAPSYSQSVFETALKTEIAVGNYTKLRQDCSEERTNMAFLIEEMCKLKQYKEDAYFTALSIADKHLVYTIVGGNSLPCFINLAIVSCLMSAKLEQPMCPSFVRMQKLVKKEWGVSTKTSEFCNLEEKILRTLNFEVQNTSHLLFLDRYLRLYGLDQHATCEVSKQVRSLTIQLIKEYTKDGKSLDIKPSKIAAGGLMLAMAVCENPPQDSDLKKIDNLDTFCVYSSDGPVGSTNESPTKTSKRTSGNEVVARLACTRWFPTVQKLTTINHSAVEAVTRTMFASLRQFESVQGHFVKLIPPSQ